MIHLQIDKNRKTNTKKASSKSKCRDGGHNIDSNDTIKTIKSNHPSEEKTIDTLTICLGIICLSTAYLYFRVGHLLVSTPTLTTPTTTTDTIQIPTTTTLAPLSDGEYHSSVIRMKELARVEQSIIVEMNIVVDKWTKIDSNSSGDFWHKGLSKIKS